jgi:beta-xylosidase
VATGWQLAMRSKSPYGPYECKTVMAQGKSSVNGPHQGGWVHTAQGEDWFLHFQNKGAYGRVVHLQPLTWKNNWPVIGIDKNGDLCGEPVMKYRKPKSSSSVICNPAESDEFNSPKLGLQWQWQADYRQAFGMPTANGVIRLFTNKLKDGQSLWAAPNLLLQKTPVDKFTATTKMRFASKAENQYGGIVMMGMDYSALVVKRVGEEFQLLQLTCQKADRGGKETSQLITTMKPTEIDKVDYKRAIYIDLYLRMTVDKGVCRFAYSTNGKKFKDAGDAFTMREGKWIGAKIGFVSEETNQKADRGWIDADWFRVTK